MTILYITRKFPPSIGGMQTQGFNLYKQLSVNNEIILISWGYSQSFLPFFFIYAAVSSIGRLLTGRVDIIQLQDLVLSPLGALLKALFNKPVLTISHGRDSAYQGILYDFFVIGSASRLDKIICVSNYMKERLHGRGVPKNKLAVIPNGIFSNDFREGPLRREESARLIESLYKIDLKDKKVILSVARLVPKKGIKEFIRTIFTRINKRFEKAVFIVAGDGGERLNILKAAHECGLSDKVFLAGLIEPGSRAYNALFAASDVFVMPNVRVKGDSEGFGIVMLEAISKGLPVVAYDVDGIRDALHNGKNGILVKEDDATAFADAVLSFIYDGDQKDEFIRKAREYTKENFNWDRVAGMYLKEYARLLK
jgi:glycosyltransferase involved in cell wall biosynthesis